VPSPPQPSHVVATASAPDVASAPSATAADDDQALTLEAYIDSVRCTTCNECTNLNSRLFSYNSEKQAYVKDVSAGTFQQLVIAAERCPVSIIHPGSPLNPKEKDLPKWLKRAEKFN
jgi:pyruvate-ferredoxin/flavodoxin oxidoreductase